MEPNAATSERSSGHRRYHRSRRHRKNPAPFYARLAVIALAVVLLVTLAWSTVRFFLHKSARTDPTLQSVLDSSEAARRSDFWQHQVLESIDAAAEEAQLDNLTGAEMDVDRATSLVESARIEARTAHPDFFELAIAALDASLRPHPENTRLTEHVALARIELAQFRSFLAGGLGKTSADSQNVVNDASLSSASRSGFKNTTDPTPADARSDDGHLMLHMPRSISANHRFNPAAAGGAWIDATPMPERAEILLPPATRLLVDNVRVQDMTIQGASQTLDGIHWGNVTFVGTRVRYEGGEVDLHNVHFERCTFGFATNDHGARLATAIALGQSSIVIN